MKFMNFMIEQNSCAVVTGKLHYTNTYSIDAIKLQGVDSLIKTIKSNKSQTKSII